MMLRVNEKDKLRDLFDHVFEAYKNKSFSHIAYYNHVKGKIAVGEKLISSTNKITDF